MVSLVLTEGHFYCQPKTFTPWNNKILLFLFECSNFRKTFPFIVGHPSMSVWLLLEYNQLLEWKTWSRLKSVALSWFGNCLQCTVVNSKWNIATWVRFIHKTVTISEQYRFLIAVYLNTPGEQHTFTSSLQYEPLMAVLLPFVSSASWLAADRANCHLIYKTMCPSLFCLLETVCLEKYTDIHFVFGNHITLWFSSGELCKWHTVIYHFV